MPKIRVLIADDHPIVRQGLSHLCECEEDLECIATVESGEDLVQAVQELTPDVVVVDVAMPNMNGIEASKVIKEEYPNIKILVISAYKYDYYVLACLRAKVDGYILKNEPPTDIANAIRTVYSGKVVFESDSIGTLIQDLAVSRHAGDSGASELPPRELEVLKLAAQGHGNKDIANKLCISEHTVSSHFVHIFRKLGVQSRTEAILYALKQGWFSIDDTR
jgi:DNA-binding NarL/FixJ family response regulator